MSVGQYLTPAPSTQQAGHRATDRPSMLLLMTLEFQEPATAMALLRCWPPTKLSPPRCRRRRLEQGRCWVGKVQIKQWGVVTRSWSCHAVMFLHLLDGAAVYTNSIDCLTFSLAPCCGCPMCESALL